MADGSKGGPVVRCEVVGDRPRTRLDGFVVRNGQGVLGGGIACTASSPTIANNVIRGNLSAGPGGGICCYNGSNPLIVGNVIARNRAEEKGGGIAARDIFVPEDGQVVIPSAPVILGNLITGNLATEPPLGDRSLGGAPSPASTTAWLR